MIDRDKLIATVTEYTCSQRCMGHPGNRGGCCTLADRDYIIGPVDDAAEFVKRLEVRTGKPVDPNEVIVGFEEGRLLFPERKAWQFQSSYPALRVDMENSALPCKFYDVDAGQCTVHEIRPEVCRNYACATLRDVLSHF